MQQMEDNTLIGRLYVGMSAMFTVISIVSIQPYLTAVASLISIIAGIFAIRYYHKKSK